MKHPLFAFLFALLTCAVTGCGTKCDELADHLDECGFEAPEGAPEGVDVDEASGEEGECTEDNEKMADCLLGKSCDALKNGQAFYDCAGVEP